MTLPSYHHFRSLAFIRINCPFRAVSCIFGSRYFRKMPPITIYHCAPSAPARIALLTARVIGVPVDVVEVNLFEKKQLEEKFVQINPQHCLPTIEDDGFILWESRAIAAYFANKYAKDDAIYPRDPQQRALVDHRLYFDAGTLFPRIREICRPVMFFGETTVPQHKTDDLKKAMDLLELFLVKDWVAGDHYTLADISISVSMSNILAVGWDISKYPKIQAWLRRCEETLPGFDENLAGAKIYGDVVKNNLTEPVN